MSFITPILTTLPEICAWAAPPANARASAATSDESFSFMVLPPCAFGTSTIGPLRSHPEVFVQHAHLLLELRRVEPLDDAPVLHHVEPVGQRRRETEVLLDHHD